MANSIQFYNNTIISKIKVYYIITNTPLSIKVYIVELINGVLISRNGLSPFQKCYTMWKGVYLQCHLLVSDIALFVLTLSASC